MNSLPFGTLDLDPEPFVAAGPPRRVRCYHRGCKELLRPPAQNPTYLGEVCPIHGIRCHSSGTYSYEDLRRNIIISPDLFVDGIVKNSFKYDTKRLGYENSEDALTWNVFRSLQKARCLAQVARWITCLDIKEEPRLYLWGICLTGDTFQPWDLLCAARNRFEPGKRPPTEPDIALYLPERYLILIEAKFTSLNPVYTDKKKRKLLDDYHDQALQMLDVEKARQSDRVYSQLWRNMIFAEWMARDANAGTLAHVANLTRLSQDHKSCGEFQGMMNAASTGRFTRLTWEDLCVRLAEFPGLSRLRQYLETKTASLVRAFELTAKLHA